MEMLVFPMACHNHIRMANIPAAVHPQIQINGKELFVEYKMKLIKTKASTTNQIKIKRLNPITRNQFLFDGIIISNPL
jgi:hypothetical protein